jgi:hypothetical protein
LNFLLMLQQVLGLPHEMPFQIRLLKILLAVGVQGMLGSGTLNNVRHLGAVSG